MNIFSDFYSPLKPIKQRNSLIDLLRFVAIVLMVFFHFGYDLNLFHLWEFDPQGIFGFYLPRLIVTLFLLSSGLSLNLKNQKIPATEALERVTPRFWKLAVYALAITLVTKVMFPNNWVYFGTLHCLAVLSLIAIPFFGRAKAALLTGIVIQLNYFMGFSLKDPLDFVTIKSVDYIPIYPWSGVFLIGMGLAPYISRFRIDKASKFFTFCSMVSQKSLPIYLLHQPIIYSTIALFNKFNQ